MPPDNPPPERDPAHREVSPETKDEFLLLVDELTERAKFSKVLRVKNFSGALPDGRGVNVTFTPTTEIPDHVEGIRARVVVSIPSTEQVGFQHQTLWQLMSNGRFSVEKSILSPDMLRDFTFAGDEPTHEEMLQFADALNKNQELQTAMKKLDEEKKFGLNIATEAEAQEAIEILKQLQKQENNKQ